MITVPPILVSSSEVVFEHRPEGKSPLKHLVKDQTVPAKVLKVMTNRRALLMIAGQKVTAKTFLPLQSGQTILLKVEQAGDQQVFKFAGQLEDGAGANQRALIGSFGKTRPYVILSQLLDGMRSMESGNTSGSFKHLAALKDLVNTLSLKSEVPSDGFLKRLINGSGLVWESKLAALASKGDVPTQAAIEHLVSGDLKALTFQLLSGPKGAIPEALIEQFKTVLEGLEQHQLLNQHLLESQGRYLLPIILGEPHFFKFGQLLLDLGTRKKGEPNESRLVTVSFLLALSRLGELRADFSILKNSLTGTFGVADQAAQELVSSYLPELRKKLQDHGYLVHDISCCVLEPQQLSETSLVAQAVTPVADGFFNLVV